MKKKNKESKIIFLMLLILFTVFLILPVFRLLLKSFWGEEGPTLAHYSGVIFSGGFGKALGNQFSCGIGQRADNHSPGFFSGLYDQLYQYSPLDEGDDQGGGPSSHVSSYDYLWICDHIFLR